MMQPSLKTLLTTLAIFLALSVSTTAAGEGMLLPEPAAPISPNGWRIQIAQDTSFKSLVYYAPYRFPTTINLRRSGVYHLRLMRGNSVGIAYSFVYLEPGKAHKIKWSEAEAAPKAIRIALYNRNRDRTEWQTDAPSIELASKTFAQILLITASSQPKQIPSLTLVGEQTVQTPQPKPQVTKRAPTQPTKLAHTSKRPEPIRLKQNKGPGTQNKGPGTQNKGPGTQNKGPGTQNKGPGTQNKGPGTQNKGPGTHTTPFKRHSHAGLLIGSRVEDLTLKSTNGSETSELQAYVVGGYGHLRFTELFGLDLRGYTFRANHEIGEFVIDEGRSAYDLSLNLHMGPRSHLFHLGLASAYRQLNWVDFGQNPSGELLSPASGDEIFVGFKTGYTLTLTQWNLGLEALYLYNYDGAGSLQGARLFAASKMNSWLNLVAGGEYEKATADTCPFNTKTCDQGRNSATIESYLITFGLEASF